MIFLYLFITFFEIGLFGFGGGYGMLSLIQGEVVMHHQWLTTAQFTDIVAISRHRGYLADDPRTYRHQQRHVLRLYRS